MQVRQVVLSILDWRKGMFVLTKARSPVQSAATRYSTQSIMDGLRRIDETEHFVDGIGGYEALILRQDEDIVGHWTNRRILLQLATGRLGPGSGCCDWNESGRSC